MLKNKAQRNSNASLSRLTTTQLLRKENRDLLTKNIVILENDGRQISVSFPIDIFLNDFGGWQVLREKGYDVDRLSREWAIQNIGKRNSAMEAL
jgi:hypothetical protein